MQKILIIDDEIAEVLATGFKAAPESRDLEFYTAADGGVGLTMAREIKPSLVLLDVELPTVDGFTVLTELHNGTKPVQTRVIMMSGYKTDLATAIKCVRAGACDYFLKGELNTTQQLQRIRRALLLESTFNHQIANLSASAKALIDEASQLKEQYESLRKEHDETLARIKNDRDRLLLTTSVKIISMLLAAACVVGLRRFGEVTNPIALSVILVALVVLLFLPAEKIISIKASSKAVDASIDLERNQQAVDGPHPQPRTE